MEEQGSQGPDEPDPEDHSEWLVIATPEPPTAGALDPPAPKEAGEAEQLVVESSRSSATRRAAASFGRPVSRGYGAPSSGPRPDRLLRRQEPLFEPAASEPPKRFYVVLRDFEGEPFIPALVGRCWASIQSFVEGGPIGGTAKERFGPAHFQGFAEEIEAREFVRVNGSEWPKEILP